MFGKILNYINFKFENLNFIALILMIVAYFSIKFFNITEIYENSILENISLIPLILGAIICFKQKTLKPLFIFAGLIYILLILRELSYGRVIFCAIPDSPHEFYKWSHYKYGYLAHVFVGIYIALGVLWALINKIWIDFIELSRKIKFPFWTMFSCGVLTIFQIHFENLGNTIFEEIIELGLYILLLVFALIYTRKN